MTKLVDLTGRRFGRLSILHKADLKFDGRHIGWVCRCDCGTIATIRGNALKNGQTASCGCLRNEKSSARAYRHGRSRTPEWTTWCKMRQRCKDPNSKDFPDYGGRGITICDRWSDFSAFLADMGPKPSQSASLNRKDNSAGYSPDNCEWASPQEQSNNRRSSVYHQYQGQPMTLRQALTIAGDLVSFRTARGRLEKGWPIANAVETPVMR